MIALLRFLDSVLIRLESWAYSLLSRIHGARGLERYRVTRSGKDALTFLYAVASSIEQAKEVRMTTGEMGHRLLENPWLMEALERAHTENNAKIEIIHGPRVDPATQRVFELAGRGVVTLFRAPEYLPHHFMLVESTDGAVTVIDESPHLETAWTQDQVGGLTTLFEGPIRVYYVISNPVRLAGLLNGNFERIKATASPSIAHPGSTRILRPPAIRVLLSFLRLFLYRILVQPVVIMFDLPLDLLRRPKIKLTDDEFRQLVLGSVAKDVARLGDSPVRISVLLADMTLGELRVHLTWGDFNEREREIRCKKYQGVGGSVWASGTPMAASLRELTPEEVHEIWKYSPDQIKVTGHIGSKLAVPIHDGGDDSRIIGVLVIDSSESLSDSKLDTDRAIRNMLELARLTAAFLDAGAL